MWLTRNDTSGCINLLKIDLTGSLHANYDKQRIEHPLETRKESKIIPLLQLVKQMKSTAARYLQMQPHLILLWGPKTIPQRTTTNYFLPTTSKSWWLLFGAKLIRRLRQLFHNTTRVRRPVSNILRKKMRRLIRTKQRKHRKVTIKPEWYIVFISRLLLFIKVNTIIIN